MHGHLGFFEVEEGGVQARELFHAHGRLPGPEGLAVAAATRPAVLSIVGAAAGPRAKPSGYAPRDHTLVMPLFCCAVWMYSNCHDEFKMNDTHE
jgi:hypothetical protein